MSEIVDELIKMRAWFASPERWCQGRFARDASGMSVRPKEDGVVALCLSGYGIRFLDGNDCRLDMAIAIVMAAGYDPRKVSTIEINDSVDHPRLLGILDDAIALASASASAPDGSWSS